MLKRVLPAILAIFAFSSYLTAAPCETLASLALPNITITMAQLVAPGGFTPPVAPRAGPGGGRGGTTTNVYASLPAFCRIAATLKPTSDSDIKIEVWMPAIGWNAKLLSVGNGAWAGSISYSDMAAAVAAGYAAASTDTGHTGGSAAFVVGHPEKVIDFSYRAVHEMTVSAKAIVNAFYDSAPKYAYFKGCSTGGRQALTEAQRYPQDYDGIIAGASAVNASRLHGTQVWVAAESHRDAASLIPANKYAALHNAVLAACDAKDGVTDRVLENPRQCRFDPGVLLCKDGDSPSCLTAPQVATAKKIYAGPGVFPGYELGSEGGWNGTMAMPVGIAYDMYRYLVFQDPAWDYKSIDVKKDIALFDKAIGPTMNSSDTNLKPFFDHGGKLLMYHGWADPGIPAGNSVEYYTKVVKTTGGAAKASNSIRLFMLPGVGHCAGGDGPSTFDSTSALDLWRDKGTAPDSIVASRITNGVVEKTRPLCPYPQVAQYRGTGSTNDSTSFVCK
jgi:feruloyl esterase